MFWVKNEAEGFATQSAALSGVALKWNGPAAPAGGPADASKVASSSGGHPQRKAAQKEYRLIAGTLDSGTALWARSGPLEKVSAPCQCAPAAASPLDPDLPGRASHTTAMSSRKSTAEA